jgi:hypothetical protein
LETDQATVFLLANEINPPVVAERDVKSLVEVDKDGHHLHQRPVAGFTLVHGFLLGM